VKRATYQCDNCGKDRDDDTNHWFVLMKEVAPLAHDERDYGLIIRRWDENFAEVRDAKHACGQDCAMQMASRFLATGNFERKAVGAEK
jgi:ribosomal protein L37AE/L43A